MTYCLGMLLDEGLLVASDSRTNAGVDHIATFAKMHIFEEAGERLIVMMNSGNLATTQSVISLLRMRTQLKDEESILTVKTLYEVAELVGETVREVVNRDSDGHLSASNVDYGCSFIVAGQIKGEEPRLFNIYPQGNFIEATKDTMYFQIGESKYGKPIIDRVIRRDTPLAVAAKCALISFDSTIKSNLSVGLPIDMLLYRTDSFAKAIPHRIDAEDPYFRRIRQDWGKGLRQVFSKLPDASWFDE
ncbi:proteasome-type protease [Leeia sp. TBRC 13508]|uniref:Proteasome-type protease n=1 Tax=Leeia speluncae TaxID=2884804 RepID=A0ABS8D846_9NEIS|nr:proteasome-type protease [Leeia speluncae]MCB6184381.1 proteasome-type protease [Leeia speluncae]